MQTFIHPEKEAGKRFYLDFNGKGPIVMLNLLKFREFANYSEHLELDTGTKISGSEAYKLYMNYTKPLLEKSGGKILFYGMSQHFLIGPENEKWDCVLLVEHKSVESFMAFANDYQYLKTAGHRTAALAEARLLPINELNKF